MARGSKNTDYSNYKSFVKMHPDLGKLKVWQAYNDMQHKRGLKGVAKQRGLDMVREVRDVEKRSYVHKSENKSKVKSNHYFDKRSEYVSRQKETLSKIMGVDQVGKIKSVVKIIFEHDEDEFTKRSNFGIWIPFQRSVNKVSIQTVKKYTRSFLSDVYPKILKRYAPEAFDNGIHEDIIDLLSELNTVKNMEDYEQVMADHNFNIIQVRQEYWNDGEERKGKKRKKK